MKRTLIVALILVFAIITVATAADIMTFENKKGTITFKHKEHQERLAVTAPNATKVLLPSSLLTKPLVTKPARLATRR